jgi:hypothetical protein
MLESLGVALHPELGLLDATIPMQNDDVGEMFEVNFIAVPATIEPEKQNNWERIMAARRIGPAGKVAGAPRN